ncbi:MAG: EamA family transporter, partial [Candidatus Diapherotrites archaeon]|nr:EamA family transporter [Candidatus Diapherotrites archaeon]
MEERPSKKMFIILFFTMLLWGSFHPISKVLLNDLPPFTVAFFRIFLSMLFFLPFLFIGKKIPTADTKDYKNILIAALALV